MTDQETLRQMWGRGYPAPFILTHENVSHWIYTPTMIDEDGFGPIDPDEPERQTSDITEAEKAEFLQLIYQGLNRMEAARHLGYKGRHFRALCSPRSPFYDEDFANEYAEAANSPEYQSSFLERLRAETARRALDHSDRLLEKLNMIKDPEWLPLRQKDININVRAVLSQHLGQLSTAQLEQLIAWMDEKSNAEIIEGIAHEIGPAVEDAA